MVESKTNQPVVYGYWREDIEQRPGHSKELISRWNKDPSKLQEPVYNGCSTLYELFQKTVREKPTHPFLGTRNNNKDGRPYEWKTFSEIDTISELYSKGMKALDLAPDTEADGINWNYIGIFTKNREEWAINNLACMRSSVAVVPFFDSLGADALSYIINQCGLSTMCIDKTSVENLIHLKETKCPSLKNLVVFDPIQEGWNEKAQEAGLKLYQFQDVVNAGQEHPEITFKEPTPETNHIICYTSGTTGDPKGAIIGHKQLVANIFFFDNGLFEFTENDVHISYLPYGHAYEQSLFWTSIAYGFCCGYYSGDPLKLMEDMAVLKPTIFFTVPRIMNRLHAKLVDAIKSFPEEEQKKFQQQMHQITTEGIIDFEFYKNPYFAKLKGILGGRVRTIGTGSAPINGEVLTYLRAAFGVTIHEGYGQTEGLLQSVVDKNDLSAGLVGGPAPYSKFRLRDLPEMGYLHTDDPPRGELQFYAHTNFKGYFKNPERTAEAFSDDGWLNSGDVCVIYPNASIKIVDRAKNIFKLAQAEYIAPEKLENIYVQCPLISQIFVHGDSLQYFIVAIIVPDPEVLPSWAKENGLEALSKEELLSHELLKKAVFEQLEEKAKEFKLTGIERIKRIHITGEPMTIQNDLVTPLLKLKRFNARKHYADIISKLYEDAQ